MLCLIHADTLPQTTITSLSCLWKSLSHAHFKCPGKSGSYAPIHDISSRRITVRFAPSIALSSQKNASCQVSRTIRGRFVWRARAVPKLSSWSRFVIPLRGGRPSNDKNTSAVSSAKCSISVLLPIRRRPRQATSDDVVFRHNEAKSLRYSFLPTNTRPPMGRERENYNISRPLKSMPYGREILKN